MPSPKKEASEIKKDTSSGEIKRTSPRRKEKIPSSVKNSVWNYYIGTETKKGNCFCCKLEEISTANFHCGHVISEKNGGEVTIQNLRPVCMQCNLSMSTNNMLDFMKKYGYDKINNGKEEKEIPLKVESPKKGKEFNWNKLPVKELKYICKVNDLKVGGIKKDLIDRINSKNIDYNSYLKEELNLFSLPILKKICDEYEVKKTGKKIDIVDRLIEAKVLISELDVDSSIGTSLPENENKKPSVNVIEIDNLDSLNKKNLYDDLLKIKNISLDN
jgi:5-methylcytosine-specific restriction endonuclease McrA